MADLHITKGSGKMAGMFSINTPASTNPFCKTMAKTDSVCSKCFAMRYESFRRSLIPAFEKNVKLLLDKEYKPLKVPYTIVRFHSFGELHNGIHYANFLKIAFTNPKTHFTLWTKRKNIIQEYTRNGGLVPSNMTLIYSNPQVDKKQSKPPKGFDKVFNIFSKKHAENEGIVINCGSNDCSSCMLCYSHNKVTVINERIK